MNRNGDQVPKYVYVEHGGEALADLIETELTASFKFHVVDRQKVAAVVKELAFQGSDLVDVKTAATIGGLLGADALLVGKVSSLNAGLMASKTAEGNSVSFYVDSAGFTAKLIHVATGEILAICDKSGSTANFLQDGFVVTNLNVNTEWTRRKAAIGSIAQILVREFVDVFPKAE